MLIKLVALGATDDLREYLGIVSLDLTKIWDPSGYNLLHLAAYKNNN